MDDRDLIPISDLGPIQPTI